MKKGWIIAAVVLIVLGLAVFAGAFAAVGFDFYRFNTEEYVENTYTASADFQKIEIRTRESDLAFAPAEDDVLRVVCKESKKVKYKVSAEEGLLRITAEDSRNLLDRLQFALRPLAVTVYLPGEQYDSLSVESGTGDVAIPDRFTFGSVRIQTSTGGIGIEGLRAGNVELSVSTGKVEAAAVSCTEDFTVKVSTGSTILRNVTCKNLISTGGTGGITLKETVASDRMEIQRNTGNVQFENCDAGRITVKTSTGDVTGTLNSEKSFVTETSTGKVEVPSGAGGLCEITTSTGDIRIRLS